MSCHLVTQSCLTLRQTWTIAPQAPLSMGFSRHKYYSGLPVPSPGDLPDSGIKPGSPTLQEDSLLSEPPEKIVNLNVSGFVGQMVSVGTAQLCHHAKLAIGIRC